MDPASCAADQPRLALRACGQVCASESCVPYRPPPKASRRRRISNQLRQQWRAGVDCDKVDVDLRWKAHKATIVDDLQAAVDKIDKHVGMSAWRKADLLRCVEQGFYFEASKVRGIGQEATGQTIPDGMDSITDDEVEVLCGAGYEADADAGREQGSRTCFLQPPAFSYIPNIRIIWSPSQWVLSYSQVSYHPRTEFEHKCNMSPIANVKDSPNTKCVHVPFHWSGATDYQRVMFLEHT